MSKTTLRLFLVETFVVVKHTSAILQISLATSPYLPSLPQRVRSFRAHFEHSTNLLSRKDIDLLKRPPPVLSQTQRLPASRVRFGAPQSHLRRLASAGGGSRLVKIQHRTQRCRRGRCKGIAELN